MVTLTCTHCGKSFEREAWRAKRVRAHHYCSPKCFRLHTSPVLQAHPEIVSGETPLTGNCVQCGKPFTFKAKRYGKAKYCSRVCMLFGGILPDYRGAANPNYRHGQNQAAARGMALRWLPQRCAVCGWETHVDVHHIVPKTQGGKNDLSNLVMLCPNHHRMADDGMLTRAELTALTTAASLRTG